MRRNNGGIGGILMVMVKNGDIDTNGSNECDEEKDEKGWLLVPFPSATVCLVADLAAFAICEPFVYYY